MIFERRLRGFRFFNLGWLGSCGVGVFESKSGKRLRGGAIVVKGRKVSLMRLVYPKGLAFVFDFCPLCGNSCWQVVFEGYDDLEDAVAVGGVE